MPARRKPLSVGCLMYVSVCQRPIFIVAKLHNYRQTTKQNSKKSCKDSKKPSLCNFYCANQCPIGQQYVPEIKIKDLSQIVLEMLASLNKLDKRRERLIEITADGVIDSDEMDDFVYIQNELEKISITVETLQLWSEKMIANGVIDEQEYNKRRTELK